MSVFYEKVWIPRRIAFREKLNILAKSHEKLFIKEVEDWERRLTNLEEDVQKLIEENSDAVA